MLLQNARVHDDEDSCAPRAFGSFGMDDALLHPNPTSTDADGRFDYLRNKFRTPEDVHDVYFLGDVLEPRKGFFAQHFGFVWIHWNDAIARGLQVFGNTMTGPKLSVR